MRPADERILVISDGGIASAVTLAMPARTDHVTAWVPPEGTSCFDAPAAGAVVGPGALAATQRLADLLGLRGVERCRAPWISGAASGGATGGTIGAPSAMILLAACEDARRLGCGVVAWPVICNDDPDRMLAADETASLVARLSWLADPLAPSSAAATSRHLPSVRTPLADLTIAQIADLALDLDVPVDAFWWSGGDTSAAARAVGTLWEPAIASALERRGYAGASPATDRRDA
jgi:hypothetical protein